MRKIVIVISILFLIFLDLWSKIYIEETLFGSWKALCEDRSLSTFATTSYCDHDILQISDFFAITLSYNDGVAFSLPIRGLILQILTILLIFVLIIYYIREEYPKYSRLLDTGYVCIFAGALSHAYERIFVGYVVDFIWVKYFAILNFADIFISIGAFLILLFYVLHRKHW